ncbi:MAG: DISARM system helicase DrmA [Myxococcales bacterium]|nr:DISARM system helicase DrmA [Myxococcales bacterium]
MATTTTEVRAHLVRALEADVVGPFDPELREELLDLPPSRFYLTGFLAPEAAREQNDPEAEDDTPEAGDVLDEEDSAGQEPEPKQRRRFPASMGVTVLVPAAAREVTATVSYADYVPEATEALPDDEGLPGKKRGRAKILWRRIEREPVSTTLPLEASAIAKGVAVAKAGGVKLRGALKPALAPGLPEGTRALSLFVVNERPVEGDVLKAKDDAFIFQVGLSLSSDVGFVARPNRRGASSGDLDERTADLQFRTKVELAVGHGVSVAEPRADADGQVRRVETAWLPRYEVKRVMTREVDGVETAMETLAALHARDDPPAAVRAALGQLPELYGGWIAAQRAVEVGGAEREETKTTLLGEAERARRRIASGIERLASDAEVREAFCLANQAMARAARQRNPERYEDGGAPKWRLFQLAFVLLNIDGVSDERHVDREIAELIFFPTGGGKTEAYLGVIAVTLLLRRMRGQARADEGLGVAVILRYTLRLLTLDQLGRAATLICALELLRREQPAKLGEVRFSVGLWVGRAATPNTMDDARKQVTEYKNSKSASKRSPCPLTHCPWCRSELDRDSLTLAPARGPTEVIVSCNNWRDKCPFNTRQHEEGVPVVFVDEQVYRELPCFIVGTVDKFAMLPWRGETGMLFGRVLAYEGRKCIGPLDGKSVQAKKSATKVPDGFRPPELIVQDELHLISGPLGTMVGLYETAIEFLSRRGAQGDAPVRPKVIASTATVRRAAEQVRALFERPDLAMFPPAGIDDSETYFARVDHESVGRLYVGLAASGRAMKAILLRAYVSMLCAAQRHYQTGGEKLQAADPYMTVVGYFNSLRELGGMRRLVEDEVRTRADRIENRRPRDFDGDHPWYRRRELSSEPVELTSRESTANVSKTKARLGLHAVEEGCVDVLLASNMISVGVDIDRLGLMIIAGQPKTTAEYIQASSRVGRDVRRPGLALTCLNVHKPRDRSHYERFVAYHQSFYRDVEATSVTPFSGPALERGLAGVMVAMTRLCETEMTPPKAAVEIGTHRALADAAVEALARRAGQHAAGAAQAASELEDAVRDRARNLVDAWQTLIKQDSEDAGAPRRSYSKYDVERGGRPLLHTWDEREDRQGAEAKFRAPTSMRDVEETVHLWLERGNLGGRGGGNV